MKKVLALLMVFALGLMTVQAQGDNTVIKKTKKEAKAYVEKKQNDTTTAKKPSKTKDAIDQVYNPTGEEKPEIIRDRLVMDIYHSFWMGMPKGVNYNKFHPGFSISALWDFKLPRKSPISFGLGLGFSYYSQFTDALLKVDDGWIMKYFVINSDIKNKMNRINYMNCNIPIEIRFRHSSGFKFSIGARIGLIAEVSQSYYGDDPDGGEIGRRFKNREIYNTQDVSVEVYTRIGWKPIAIFYSVHVTKIFKNDIGPAMFPMSLGLSISFF